MLGTYRMEGKLAMREIELSICDSTRAIYGIKTQLAWAGR